MWMITVTLSIMLSIFSTAVMSYISMATPIGPWIASTLVLIAMLVFHLFRQKKDVSEQIAYAVAAGSVGGILATACGFSYPTLFFLDAPLFNSWMSEPLYFCAVLSGLALLGGWFGLWIADCIENKLIIQENLAFPIGQLTYKMITAQQQLRKSIELCVGFVGTTLFCILQDGFIFFTGIIPRTLVLVRSTALSIVIIPAIEFDLWPMLWAIGFVTGHVIAVPLLVGALSKIFVINPINSTFFATTSSMEFILAFCSGMVLSGALTGLISTPKTLWKAAKKILEKNGTGQPAFDHFWRSPLFLLESAALFISISAFLTYFKFSFIAQIYLVLFTFVCAYQIATIAGKIGLAQLGRFATFVMVPALFIFSTSTIQTVFIATFVELAGGVLTDILFSRKMAYLGSFSDRTMRRYQYLGLIVSALSVGIIFWLLINHFGLGSPDLFAQRAQARQLLINVTSFNYYILAIGFVFGYLLKFIHVNPMLVLGGLLMPLNISIGLIAGGLCTMLVKDKEEWYPFWSGVFAANSIWMIIKAVV